MRKLRVSEWCCAIRFNKSSDTSILNDTESEFTVLKDNYRYWTADPFLIESNGKYYLFFEAYDRLKRKGVIGYREVAENYCGKIRIVYEDDGHLSYPFIFEENGNIYIIPEAYASGTLYRLKCEHFPDKWVKERVIANIELLDTTPVKYNGVDYYVSEQEDYDGVFDRVDLFYMKNGQLEECAANPVKRDAESARGAGKFFEYQGKLIRPSQNCGKFYGESLNFNEVILISENGYEERLFKKIDIGSLKLSCDMGFVGIHTYNRVDNVEVVDLKIGASFNLLNIIGGVLKRVKGLFK